MTGMVRPPDMGTVTCRPTKACMRSSRRQQEVKSWKGRWNCRCTTCSCAATVLPFPLFLVLAVSVITPQPAKAKDLYRGSSQHRHGQQMLILVCCSKALLHSI